MTRRKDEMAQKDKKEENIHTLWGLITCFFSKLLFI
jgi:hypothetical protein